MLKVLLEPFDRGSIIPDLSIGMVVMVHVDCSNDKVSGKLADVQGSLSILSGDNNVFNDLRLLTRGETFLVKRDRHFVLPVNVLST